MRRHLVISAVNLVEGGTLTILRESLASAARCLGDEWDITALVHDAALVDEPRARIVAFPKAKSSWGRRLWLEWHGFLLPSKQWNADLWLSLHDITPRVTARRQAVYCHNPSPFYRPSWHEARLDPKFKLFTMFYLRLYKSFIRRNHMVIVQQQWLRDSFRHHTGHPNILVAYPGLAPAATAAAAPLRRPEPGRPLRLLYPSLPRVFKNMETPCAAVAMLPPEIAGGVDLRLTLDGSANAYDRELVERFGGTPGISFIGRQDRDAMMREYRDCDMVLFPSRLETWGLPISEAKSFAKPLLVADLPYAHETVGTYADVSFLPPDDAEAWAGAFAAVAQGRWTPEGQDAALPDPPFARDWPQLWAELVDGL